MLLRQVQARPLQGDHLRALRRRGHAGQGAPRAHGPHRPGRAGQPHLVLQGRPEPHRLHARHRPQGAGEGPLLRRLDRHRGGRGGPRGRARPAPGRGQRHDRAVRPGQGGAPPRAERAPRAPRRVAARGRGPRPDRRGRVLDRRPQARPHLGGPRGAPRADRRRPQAGRDRPPQGDRRRAQGHRALHGGGHRPPHARLADLQGPQAAPDRGRRAALPRDEGAVRLPARLRRPLQGRHGRRGDQGAARPDRPRGRGRDAARDHPDQQGPAPGARPQAPEGRVGVPPQHQPPRVDGARGDPGHPAGAAPDGAARRWPLRHQRPQRPLPPRHQPQQPPEAPARPRARPRSS